MSPVNPTSAWGKDFSFPHQSQGRLRAEFSKDEAICNACPRLSELDIIYCTICFPFFHPQKQGNVLLCSALVSSWNSFLGLQVPLEGCGARMYPCLTHTQEAAGETLSRTHLQGQSHLTATVGIKSRLIDSYLGCLLLHSWLALDLPITTETKTRQNSSVLCPGSSTIPPMALSRSQARRPR